jgi:hypothetical protein
MDAAALVTPYNNIAFRRKKNTWYSIADGSWTNKNIWISNSRRRYDYPQPGDDVYVNHTVTSNTSVSINNLYISGSLLFDNVARTITVNGDIQVAGSVNMSNAAHNLILNGVNNYISNFTSGTNSTVTYARVGDQTVMNLTYCNMSINGGAIKSTAGSTTLNGNLIIINGKLELGGYNFIVNGTTTLPQNGNFKLLSKSGSGNVLFGGAVSMSNTQGYSAIDFSGGNPTVECRGGLLFTYSSVNWFKSGTGQWTFTTNNQSINITTSNNGQLFFDCPILISGAITVTNINASNTGGVVYMQLNNIINGDNANSKFLNQGAVYFKNSTLPMATGIWDYLSSSASVVGYIFDGDYTLPYTSYQGLVIGGSGVKTLIGNTVLSTYLIVLQSASLELSSYDLTVTSTSTINGSASLLKSSSGNVLFIGLLYVTGSGGTGFGVLNFSSGNPTVECRGGITISTLSGNILTGTGQWTFSTNSQTIEYRSSFSSTIDFYCPILISGAITVTIYTSSGAGTLRFLNTVNGDNTASTLDNRLTGTSRFQYMANQRPMLTGVLQTNGAENTFIYNKAGDQDITGGTYRTLTLAGSGVKTLQGNVVVATAYTLTAPATLNLNGYTRT